MRALRFLGLGAVAALPLGFAARVAGAPEPIAIVYSLTGKASVASPHAGRRSLRLFDRLSAGTTLEAGPRSRLALVFVNGLRYELGERSRARLGLQDLASRTGHVRPLPALPRLPSLAPIAKEDRPGPRAGAVRVRTERIAGLYPRHGAATVAAATVLHFQPVEGARGYRIEVRDSQGQIVFQTDLESPPAKVPDGTLGHGLAYQWTVRTLDRPGAVARGEAEFVTLSDEAARRRAELHAALAGEEDGESLALLADIDRGLGMLLEARQELQAALERSPENASLAEELAALVQQLEEGGDEPES